MAAQVFVEIGRVMVILIVAQDTGEEAAVVDVAATDWQPALALAIEALQQHQALQPPA